MKGTPKYGQYLDEDLLCSMKEGDEKALSEIYFRYWKALYKVAFNILEDDAACMDVVKDVFVWLWNNHEKTEIVCLKAYLLTAVKFKMLNVIRREKIRKEAIKKYEEIAPACNTQGNILEVKELQDMIEKFVKNLPPQAGKIFQLSRDQQLTHKEIAQRLSLSEKTVRNQINLSLKKLRVELHRHSEA